tara:strand:- start:123 stop:341 length:219 start_codon:yes stop_codon:yes gene_type:complete
MGLNITITESKFTMNTEAQIWELFYAALTPDAMFMVAVVLLTWLGFRSATAMSNDPSTALRAKLVSSVYFSS